MIAPLCNHYVTLNLLTLFVAHDSFPLHWTLLLSSGKSIRPQSDDSLSLYSQPIFTCPVKLNRLSELKNSSNFARQIELHLCAEKANKYTVVTITNKPAPFDQAVSFSEQCTLDTCIHEQSLNAGFGTF